MELEDSYEHISQNIIYITENIPSKETEEDFSHVFSQGCKCEKECTTEVCECVKKFGINYNITKTEGNGSLSTLSNYVLSSNKQKTPIYECNSNCRCKQNFCGNKLVQFGPRKNLKIVFISNQKGYGLVTDTKILEGNYICEYAGEVLVESEAIKRFRENDEGNKMNYILCSKEFYGNNEKKYYIDPTQFGNIGRYINHSCNPNCLLTHVRINGPVPKICIFAKQDIEANTELTYNYNENNVNCCNEGSEIKRISCACKEISCKKWLPNAVC